MSRTSSDPRDPLSLRLILGLKLRTIRQARGLGLKQVADRTGLSVSYLSEIEKGRKYPKPEKLLQLAAGLEVPYDELVSAQVPAELEGMSEIIESPFLREFPFHLFGIELESIYGLVGSVPTEARALVRAAFEIGRLYGFEVEPFLLAALRSLQYLRGNFFEEVEMLAQELRVREQWERATVPSLEQLRKILEVEFGVGVEETRFDDSASLASLRSVLVPGKKPRLFLNAGLLPPQRAFMVGRELGYRFLESRERSWSSPPLEVGSFEQVIHDFEAAYFSGAVLLDQEAVEAELRRFFRLEKWSPEAFLGLLQRFETTPETFLYRLSQIVPRRFGLGRLFFVRFTERQDGPRLSKILNLTSLPIPHSGLENHCRRWPGLRALQEPDSKAGGDGVEVKVQRSRFFESQEDFLVLTLSRALSLVPDARSSISLGLAIDEDLRDAVAFLDDPDIPRQDVHLTCERCPLGVGECAERAVPPTLVDRARAKERQETELEAWIAGIPERALPPGAG